MASTHFSNFLIPKRSDFAQLPHPQIDFDYWGEATKIDKISREDITKIMINDPSKFISTNCLIFKVPNQGLNGVYFIILKKNYVVKITDHFTQMVVKFIFIYHKQCCARSSFYENKVLHRQ